MQLKSYRARTIQEAIDMVRRDLGPDASVLHAREVRRSLLTRWFARRQIEVTASPETNHVPSRVPESLCRGAAHAAVSGKTKESL